MPVPIDPVLIAIDTGPPKFTAGRDGVIVVETDSGPIVFPITSGTVVDALTAEIEDGVKTGEPLSTAAAIGFPLNIATRGGPLELRDSPTLGAQIGALEASEQLGIGITPIIPKTTVPNAYGKTGPSVGTDPQNPVVVASSALESTIQNTPLTRANLTAGQNSPIAGTGGTPTAPSRFVAVSEKGSRPFVM